MATQQETTIICLPFREEKNSVRRSGIAQCRVFPETFPVRPAIPGHSMEKITRSVTRNRVTRVFEVNISVPVSRDALATAACSAKVKRVTRFAIASSF